MDKLAKMTDRLAEVKLRFRSRALDNCHEIRVLTERLQEPGARDDSREQIRRLAHSLAGTAGTFGFVEISKAAASLEDQIDAGIDDGMLTVLSEQVAATIQAIIEGETVPMPA